MTRKNQTFGYTVRAEGAYPIDNHSCSNRFYVSMIRLDDCTEIFSASLRLYSNTDNDSEVLIEVGATEPQYIKQAADCLRNAPDSFDNPDSFIDWLGGFDHVFETYSRGPAIPANKLDGTIYRPAWGVMDRERYTVIAKSEEEAKLALFKAISNNNDIDTMRDWGYYGMSMTAEPVSNQIRGEAKIFEIKRPRMEDISADSWERYQQQQEEARKWREEYEARQAAKLAEEVEAQ